MTTAQIIGACLLLAIGVAFGIPVGRLLEQYRERKKPKPHQHQGPIRQQDQHGDNGEGDR